MPWTMVSKGGLLTMLLVLGASSAKPLPGATNPVPQTSRVIIRYTNDLVGSSHKATLTEKMLQIKALGGIVEGYPLAHLGMAVIECQSVDRCEQLMEELDADADVDLVVPSSRVHLLDNPFLRRVTEKKQEDSDKRSCAANVACAELSLEGDCCPSEFGDRMECCDAEPSTAKEIRWMVAFRSASGKYLTADGKGAVTANSSSLGAHETFRLIYNSDGTYMLQGVGGTYISGNGGLVIALRSQAKGPEAGQRFKIVYNHDSTISLQTADAEYVAATTAGDVVSNHDTLDVEAKFTLVNVGSPQERFPDDPLFPKLWGMHHYDRHDVAAPAAWQKFTGEFSAGIVVGIIDTGIDYNHEDLREQMWVNTAEIPDNGIDDDDNGFVDDVHGADFANSDGDPMDDHMHGTHCAGTIAAAGNNGVGVAGVAWHGARLMALKFLSAEGGGDTGDAIRAIDYAVAHGAKILSNSWGGGGSSSALRVAIERAEQAGVLFVVAAGNSATDNDEQPQYPANYPVPNLIAVASTNVKGELSGFSCYGNQTVAVAAPGSLIYSTVPGNHYQSLSGTSMACPHVSGLAALVWMYRPSLTMHQLKEAILQSVVKEAALEGKVATGGRVNVPKALEAAEHYPAPVAPKNMPQGINFVDIDPAVGAISGVASLTAAADESDVDYYKIYYVSRFGFPLEAVAVVNATGERHLSVSINGSTGLPKYAIGLMAVAGNASGEASVRFGAELPFVPLKDYGIPLSDASGASWVGDTDVRTGVVSGVFSVQRAADESTITTYDVYWRNATGPRGPLAGSLPAIGYSIPSCAGDACTSLNVSRSTSGSYLFQRIAYGNDERLAIVASGPARVLITRFETEDNFDFLQVGTHKISGKPPTSDFPIEVNFPEGTTVEIVWYSDNSVTKAGWAFELITPRSTGELRFEAATVLGTELEVVATFGGTESPRGGLRAPLEDFGAGMAPTAAFAPLALVFDDQDVRPGFVSGVVELLPVPEANPELVTFYRVDFATETGTLLANGWNAKVHVTPDAVPWDPVRLHLHPAAVPNGATRLVARAGNAFGLSEGVTSAALVDVTEEVSKNSSAPAGQLRVTAFGRHSAGHLVLEGVAPQRTAKDWESLPKESWLQQVPQGTEVWKAPPMLSAASLPRGKVLGSFTIPGLEAATASSPTVRRAVERVLSDAISAVDRGGHVRVLRILDTSPAAAADTASSKPAATLEFGVTVGPGAPALTADRIESRLLVLAQGGTSAGLLARQLAAAIAAAGPAGGMPLGDQIHFSEPRQVGPPPEDARRLQAASTAGAVEGAAVLPAPLRWSLDTFTSRVWYGGALAAFASLVLYAPTVSRWVLVARSAHVAPVLP